MSVLVYTELSKGTLTKNAIEAASYAAQLASKIGTSAVAVCVGSGSGLDELGKYGISKVLHQTNDELNDFDAKKISAVLSNVVSSESSEIIVLSHDFSGKAIAPRLATKLDAGLVSGAVEIPETDSDFIVKKAVFSGKAFAKVAITSATKIITVLPNSIDKIENVVSIQVENFNCDLPTSNVVVKEIKKESTELSLTEAEIVVSAGRGLKGPENWGMVEDLAKELGAATACSRPVSDIGWRPHHEHVGQTGIAIRPNLYIAIGISGAIQHLAGVNGSKIIVVINTDPEAPFFKAADYGIVGDAFEVVPKLIEAVKQLKA